MGCTCSGRHGGYPRRVEEGTRAIGDAADAMTDEELETAIAALHARERELLVAADSEAAFDLMGTKFVLLSTLEGRRR
ncbi:hypothetical protein SAMN04490240_0125 [Rhodococcus pyridinivorans]|nr:hypothetical protein SAMN04490240_0125 [Rhodococcus pyridinivorans]